MARKTYGATPADFTISVGGVPVAGAVLTAWTAAAGGSRLTDLLDREGQPTTVIVSDSEAHYRFEGPDGYDKAIWLQHEDAVGSVTRYAVLPIDPPPARLTVGSVSVSSTPAVTVTGTAPDYVISFALPASAPHKASHATGGSDALTPGDIGAVPISRSVVAGAGLSGGGVLGSDVTVALADGGVTGPKMAVDSVTADKIAAGAVGADELASDSVTAAKIAAGAVGTDELSPSAVTVDKLAYGSQFLRQAQPVRAIPETHGPGINLLKQAAWWVDAASLTSAAQTVPNLGWVGSALDCQVGSTTGTDSNDPVYLPYNNGEPYIFLPGTNSATNFLTLANGLLNDGGLANVWEVTAKIRMEASTSALFTRADSAASGTGVYVNTGNLGPTAVTFDSTGTQRTHSFSPVVQFPVGQTIWVRYVVNATGPDTVYSVFTAPDSYDVPTNWTLFNTRTYTGRTGVARRTQNTRIGALYGNGSGVMHGSIWRIIEKYDGVVNIDIDFSQYEPGAFRPSLSRNGQGYNYYTATTGRKVVAVNNPVWLFGTDDSMQAPSILHNNFTGANSFTVVAAVRQYSTPGGTVVVGKRSALESGPGWALGYNGGYEFGIGDGTVNISTVAANAALSSGRMRVLVGVRNATSDTISLYVDGTLISSVADTTTATLENNLPMTVGVNGAAGEYADMELFSAALFRSALTASQVQTLTDYYRGRIGA